jgi:hypothetical protein
MRNLIRVSKANGLPFKPGTLYKWHHKGQYPEIFVKFSGSLFVDLTALQAALEKSRKNKG